MASTFKLRRGLASEWTANDPILSSGEPGLETDTGKLKFGNGVTAWSSLAYFDGEPGPQGIQGIQGPPGDDGADASMDSPTWTGTGTFSGRQIITEDALSIVSGAVAIDASLGNRFTLTATENFTLSNPTNGIAGQQITVRVTQDATGSRVMTLGSNYRLGIDIDSVVLSVTANKIDYIGLMCRDGTLWDVVSFVRGFS